MKDKHQASRMDAAYHSFLSLIYEHNMEESIMRGVLVGFSGGPDSVLLLHLLLRYQKERKFPLLAVHIHHGIRGESADSDARFASALCKSLGVEFLLKFVDVPALANQLHLGIEEAARNARYSCFFDIIRSRSDISTIALGHNATDNLETVIFHLFRGCGTGGLAGIAPVRDNIIRPILYLTKDEILSALAEEGLSYVLDETNTDTAYTRNYIRKEILPRLSRLSSSPEVSVRRVCRNLISDNDFLKREADKVYFSICDGKIMRSMLSELHPSILARVLMRLGDDAGTVLAKDHIDAIGELLKENSPFSYNLPNGIRFFADRDICYFEKLKCQPLNCMDFIKKIYPDQPLELSRGAFSISFGECQNISPNIYNFSIKANLASAIIVGELFLRYRRDGDSYYYGGMTHKLKKIFNDRKIPLRERETLPILCDEKGIVWVPGFGVRDDGANAENALNAAFFF